MWKWKKFYAVLDVFKLTDSDNEKVRDINMNECLNDGLKSTSIEKVRVQKGEGNPRHLLIMWAKLIGFAGNITCGCPRRLAITRTSR